MRVGFYVLQYCMLSGLRSTLHFSEAIAEANTRAAQLEAENNQLKYQIGRLKIMHSRKRVQINPSDCCDVASIKAHQLCRLKKLKMRQPYQQLRISTLYVLNSKFNYWC